MHLFKNMKYYGVLNLEKNRREKFKPKIKVKIKTG